ncbi:MAG: hypothetical protein SWH68_11680 [Thermodesulfobacteriota bacterium]|nr:hypothetical protein [Thermodesulfobacteriota bacterium]
MKKFTVLAMAACLAFALAVPAMAVDVDFSGYYRVRGFYNSNVTLNDNTSESEAYYDNRFRLQTVFKATDNLSVTMRFDVFDDDVWGDPDNLNGNNADEESIDFDRVYMTAMTDVGMFIIGHQQAGVWGLDVFNDDYNDDRIKYVGRSGPITFGGIIQKTIEEDSNNAWDSPDLEDGADGDQDVYYAFGIFKQDAIEGGLLAVYAKDKTDNNPYVTLFDGSGWTNGASATKIALQPYFNVAMGPMSVKGEAMWETGDIEYDDRFGDGIIVSDTDISALSYALEGDFNLDMARLYVGWVSVSGQDQGDQPNRTNSALPYGGGELTLGNTTYGGLGDDYNPFAILTDDLGGKILNSGTGMERGVDMWYLGADVTVNDNLTVNAIFGQACANEEWTGDVDDEYGMEMDIGMTYKIMDNLEYSATLAYLMTGDLGGQLAGARTATADYTDDNFGFMHQIKASF